MLVTRPPGYVLDIAPEQVDAARFERNITSAIEARELGRLDDAAVFLADALSLWRGQPLADVAYESWAQSECERLKDLYLIALETQLTIDLERGRHTSVAVEAERLAKEYPVRERFRELLMLALYRSGRQADALRAYQDARDVLVEELGIEPGPGLRALEERILAQDPDLGWQAPRRLPRFRCGGRGNAERHLRRAHARTAAPARPARRSAGRVGRAWRCCRANRASARRGCARS